MGKSSLDDSVENSPEMSVYVEERKKFRQDLKVIFAFVAGIAIAGTYYSSKEPETQIEYVPLPIPFPVPREQQDTVQTIIPPPFLGIPYVPPASKREESVLRKNWDLRRT